MLVVPRHHRRHTLIMITNRDVRIMVRYVDTEHLYPCIVFQASAWADSELINHQREQQCSCVTLNSSQIVQRTLHKEHQLVC